MGISGYAPPSPKSSGPRGRHPNRVPYRGGGSREEVRRVMAVDDMKSEVGFENLMMLI